MRSSRDLAKWGGIYTVKFVGLDSFCLSSVRYALQDGEF